jgi:twitching motility protein PilT
VTKKLIPDPQLEELVRELNAEGTSRVAVPVGDDLEPLLTEMDHRGASDLLLMVGSPPVFRVGGVLTRAGDEPLAQEEMESLFAGIVSGEMSRRLAQEGAVDFSLRLGALRFRINVHRQRGTIAAAVRALPSEIPTLAQLNLPQSLADLVKATRGLVLICGPTGAGKSTTLAALVGEINRNDARHIITIEDPIEYEHHNAKSVIEQVEVGRDSPAFAGALRAALRQDPDVILVGEMRDLDTISTAVTAAETGHLILSTLHTSDVAGAINRIVDVFPPEQQSQIRNQLALALNAIVVQHLIPRKDGHGQVVAVELMLANQPVRNHLRNNKLQNLGSEITLGKRAGMISLEDSLARFIQQGLITLEDAKARSTRPDELDSVMRR